MKIEITCAPDELQKVLEIMRTNDTQIHVDTVAQTAKEMATEPKLEVGGLAKTNKNFSDLPIHSVVVLVMKSNNTWVALDKNCKRVILHESEIDPINPLDSNPYTR